jgi:hypothetical protein
VKTEYWIFLIVGIFYIPVVIVYTMVGGEPVGIGALTLCAGLGLMIGGYLWLISRKMPFSPWSWWPLPLAAAAGLFFLGLAVGYWVSFIGAGLGIVAVVGWVFEYYRGAHAH